MFRRTLLVVESLEGRIVLTSVMGLTITTDRVEYAPGQPVVITLTQTNLSDHDVTVSHGPSTDGFLVSKDGTELWRSNAGMNPMYQVVETLAPHQSLTRTAVWTGDSSSPAPPIGSLQVASQVQVDGQSAAPVTIEVGGGTRLSPKTSRAKLTLAVQLDHHAAKVGQPILLTLTETNIGTTAATINDGAGIVAAALRDGKGHPVWQYHDLRLLPTFKGNLPPGASRQVSIQWDGKANLPGAKIKAGWYTFHLLIDGHDVTTRLKLMV